MNAALLAYKKLANIFAEWGLVMNPYGPCAWSKIEGGRSQMAIMFHIGGLLCSSLPAGAAAHCAKLLEGAHGARDELAAARGKAREGRLGWQAQKNGEA